MPEPPADAPNAPGLRARLGPINRALPPARLTWIALAVLGAYGAVYLAGLGIGSLIVLPIVAALTDLAFQRLRFDELHVPDGALATGLFLALLLPPAVPLVGAGAIAFGAIGVKHALRRKGRPILNPAASGVVLGAFLFGMAPAWWVSLGSFGEGLMIALGALLLVRNPATWRLPATFFAVFAPFSVFMRVVLGAALAPKLLVLGILDPSTIFFGLFMVAEPRTAPASPRAQPVFGAAVALGAAFLPAALPSTGILLALLLGNAGTAILPRITGSLDARRATSPSAARPPRSRVRGSGRRASGSSASGAPVWSIPKRVGSGLVVIVLIGFIAAATAGPTATPTVQLALPGHPGGAGSSGSSGSGGSATCTSDNPSISSQVLSSLHKALGPSVILSYDPSSGTTVFYDPVNLVTVTETDLYEDYGFAEFNGDDFAVQGCSP